MREFCIDCAGVLDPELRHPNRKRCIPCGIVVRRASDVARTIRWQKNNPERFKAQRAKMRRRDGRPTWAAHIAARRAANAIRAQHIQRLLADGLSYAQAAEALGMTKNMAVGSVDRLRKATGVGSPA